MAENSLIIFTRASQMLAEANTIQKAKELKDLALTAKDWAKRKGMGEEAIRYAHSYAMQAEIRMGEMIAAEEQAGRLATREKPNPGGRGGKNNVPSGYIVPATTADIGITRKERARAKTIATMSKEKQEEIIAGEKTFTQVKREEARAEAIKKVQELPSKKYRVFYADPPWKYGDTRNGLEGTTGATTHYPTMSILELCALPIAELSEESAVLFLWVTSPLLEECFPVIKAWGFKYKTSFIWDKIKHNMGHYNSVRHEFLLICTKGSCLPDIPELIDSVQSIERSQKHSEKPEEFRKIINNLYPHGKRIELFARVKVENWDSWGNE